GTQGGRAGPGPDRAGCPGGHLPRHAVRGQIPAHVAGSIPTGSGRCQYLTQMCRGVFVQCLYVSAHDRLLTRVNRLPRLVNEGLIAMSIYVKALASGSSGNALLLRAGQATVLFDAGLPGRRLATLLRSHGVVPGELDGILLSHEHSDHVLGA